MKLTQNQSLLRWLHLCLQRYQTRQSLLQLNDSQLADVGLSRKQALREGQKPFWRK